MAKYIDASALIAEIEKRLKNIRDYMRGEQNRHSSTYKNNNNYQKALGKESAYDAILNIINSVPQPQENKGCGIEFPYFGANYPDAKCIDGYLWDMDSSDEDGLFTIGGDDPCPICNTQEWLKDVMDSEIFETEEEALAYVEKLRKKYLPNYDKPEPQPIDLEKEIDKTISECTDGYNFDWEKFARHFIELGIEGGK